MPGRATASALVAAYFVVTGTSAFAETRSFAVTWFDQAVYSKDGDCAGGINPRQTEQYAKDLRDLGYTGEQIEKLMPHDDSGFARGWDRNSLRGLMNERARVNGKPANAYAHPAAVVDPQLKYLKDAKYAYGFNLDGKGQDDPKSFEDPQTHEKGIDNQLFRALGCIDGYRGTLEHDTAFWSFMWMAEKDSSPAWLVTIEGDDLSKDGPITVSMSRAIETPKYNADGSGRADMTYREDPDPRIKGNVYKGEIKKGVILITEPDGKLHLTQDQLTYPIFDMKKVHLRLWTKADGSLEGLLGGYQPLEQVYFCLAEGGLAHEDGGAAPELPGTYWLLRKLADADPDPKTGQNWSISATYHIKAVPAFVVRASAAATD